jgi:prepilin-type N-terminal cleavage/methylation domain-containing protein
MRRLDQKGVTMVELMVAMILLVIALVALAASIPYAMYGVMASGFQTTATLFTQAAIERAKAADYGSIASLQFDGATVQSTACASADLHTVVEQLDGVPVSFPGFGRCVQVEVGQPTTTTTRITVVVEYQGSVPNPIWRTTVATIRAQ